MIASHSLVRRMWSEWRTDWDRKDTWDRFCMGWEFLTIVIWRDVHANGGKLCG